MNDVILLGVRNRFLGNQMQYSEHHRHHHRCRHNNNDNDYHHDLMQNTLLVKRCKNPNKMWYAFVHLKLSDAFKECHCVVVNRSF